VKELTFATFAEVDAARAANYGADGRIRNGALSQRIANAERALAIRLLGWVPEPSTRWDDPERYAATIGELRRWAEKEVCP
jgi:hypothetical protein